MWWGGGEQGRTNKEKNWKKRNKMALSTNQSIITLNVNKLNVPIKIYRWLIT